MASGVAGGGSKRQLAPLLKLGRQHTRVATCIERIHEGGLRSTAAQAGPSRTSHAAIGSGALLSSSSGFASFYHVYPSASASSAAGPGTPGSLGFLHEAGLPFLKQASPGHGQSSHAEQSSNQHTFCGENSAADQPVRTSKGSHGLTAAWKGKATTPNVEDVDLQPPSQAFTIAESPSQQPESISLSTLSAKAAGKQPERAGILRSSARPRLIDYEHELVQRSLKVTDKVLLGVLQQDEYDSIQEDHSSLAESSNRAQYSTSSKIEAYIVLRNRARRNAIRASNGPRRQQYLSRLSDEQLVSLAEETISNISSATTPHLGEQAQQIAALFVSDVNGPIFDASDLEETGRVSLLQSSSNAADSTQALLKKLKLAADNIERSFKRHQKTRAPSQSGGGELRELATKVAEEGKLPSQSAAVADDTLFNTPLGSDRRKLVLEAVVRRAAGCELFPQQRRGGEGRRGKRPALKPAICTDVVKLLLDEQGKDARDALPLVIGSLSRTNLRGLLIQLLRAGDPGLLQTIEGLQRRLQGWHIASRRGALGQRHCESQDAVSDFPSLQEAAHLIEYYLKPEVFSVRLIKPWNQKRRAEAASSALKVFRGLIARLLRAPDEGASEPSLSVDEIIRQSQRDGHLLIAWLEQRASDPARFASQKANLTFCLTLRITMLRLLLREKAAVRAAVFMRELAKDIFRMERPVKVGEAAAYSGAPPDFLQDLATEASHIEDVAATPAEQLLASLCSQTLKLHEEQGNPVPVKSVLALSDALISLTRGVVRELSPAAVRSYIESACAVDCANAAAIALLAMRRATGHDPNIFGRLELSPQITLDVLEAMVRERRDSDVELLSRHVDIDDFGSEQDKDRFLHILAKAQVRERVMQAYRKLDAEHHLSSKSMWRMVRLLLDEGNSSHVEAEQIYRRYLAQGDQLDALDTTHTASAALAIGHESEALEYLRRAIDMSTELDMSCFSAVFHYLAKQQPEFAVRILRSAFASDQARLQAMHPTLAQLLPPTLAPRQLEPAVRSVFDLCWTYERLDLADQVYSLANSHSLTLGPSARRFAFLRTFHKHRPLTVAFALSNSTGQRQLLADNAGGICWLIKLAARNQTVQDGLKIRSMLATGAAVREATANDFSLEGGLLLFQTLFRATGLVDLSTAQLLLTKLRAKGLQMIAGHRQREREGWREAIRAVLAAARRAPELRFVTPITHFPKSRLSGVSKAPSTANYLPPSFLKAAATAFAALSDGAGINDVLNQMQAQGLNTATLRQTLSRMSTGML